MMHTIITIAVKDLMISLQNHAQTAVAIAMPIVLMIILGSAIPNGDVTLSVDVINDDSGLLGQSIINQVESDTLEVTERDKADSDLTQRLEEGNTAAALLIPEDFSTQLQAGEVPILEYRSNNDLNAPTVVSQAVNTAMARVASSVIVADVGRDLFADEENIDPDIVFAALYSEAETMWSAPPIVLEEKAVNENSNIGSGSEQSVPGTAAMFVMISMLSGASVLVIERQTGTLQRLFSVPVPKYQIVIGKMLGPILYGLVQFSILIAVGQMIGVQWGDQWLAIGALVLVYVLCTGALGFVLATFVRSESQASGMTMLVTFTLAPLGGAWWPLAIVPDFMRIIGHISPIAWLMDAFTDLIWYNGDFISILPELGVLAGLTIVLTVIGVWRFSYE